MKMILKECEDKDGCKGGYVREISSLMKMFNGSIVKFFMESLKFNIFSKDKMEMNIENN
jgi:hypothetical protein